jgi:hypothetical protein
MRLFSARGQGRVNLRIPQSLADRRRTLDVSQRVQNETPMYEVGGASAIEGGTAGIGSIQKIVWPNSPHE